MPQNEYMEKHRKKFGRRLDHEVRKRKKEARSVKDNAKKSKKLRGIKAKLFHKKRYCEKAALKKSIKHHEEKDAKKKEPEDVPEGAVPAYLLDREGVSRSKVGD